MPAMVVALPREVRFTLAYTEQDVYAIARQVGFSVNQDEVAAVLDHIDREINALSRSAAASAVDAGIANLIQVIRSAHRSLDMSASAGSRWPRRLSMC
jgi:hypothetical protein